MRGKSVSHSVMSNSLQPLRLQPARLLCPWISPGKNQLDWVTIPFSRGSSQPRDQTPVSCTAGGFLPSEPAGKPSEEEGEAFYYLVIKSQCFSESCLWAVNFTKVFALAQLFCCQLSCSCFPLSSLYEAFLTYFFEALTPDKGIIFPIDETGSIHET